MEDFSWLQTILAFLEKILLGYKTYLGTLMLLYATMRILRVPDIRKLFEGLLNRLRKVKVSDKAEAEFDPHLPSSEKPSEADRVQQTDLKVAEEGHGTGFVPSEMQLDVDEKEAKGVTKELRPSQRAWLHYFRNEFEDALRVIQEEIIESSEDREEICEALIIGISSRDRLGRGSVTEELTELTKEFDELPLAYSSLAHHYKKMKNHDRAIEMFLEVSQRSKGDARIDSIIAAVEVMQEKGDNEEAEDRLIDGLNETTTEVQQAMIFGELGNLYGNMDRPQEMFCCFERSLELNPDNDTLRFNIAWKYSDTGAHDLSLYHYRLARPENGVLNNMGVTYGHLNMPIRSIRHYKDAFEKGNTLAASNLANHLMDAGFLEEAKERLEHASLMEDVDSAVLRTLARASDLINEDGEQPTEDQALRIAKYKRTKAARYSEAYVAQSVDVPKGVWKSGDGRDILYIFFWETEKKVEGVFLHIQSSLFGPTDRTSSLYTLQANKKGRAIEVSWEYSERPASDFDIREAMRAREEKGKGYLAVSIDALRLEGFVPEFPSKKTTHIVDAVQCDGKEADEVVAEVKEYNKRQS